MKLKRQPTKEEFKLVSLAEELYHRNHRFPNIAILGTTLGIEYSRVRDLLGNEVVTAMLSNRGIEKPEDIDSKLTPEQLAAANTILNPYDKRSKAQKLISLGIEPARFHGWMNGKVFKEYMRVRSEELFEEGMPLAHISLLKEVEKGNVKAIELFYQVSGRYTGVNSAEMQNVTLLLGRLLEAIQMEVTDQDTVRRIGDRFQSIVTGGTTAPPVGEPVRAQQPPSPARALLERVEKRNGNDVS